MSSARRGTYLDTHTQTQEETAKKLKKKEPIAIYTHPDSLLVVLLQERQTTTFFLLLSLIFLCLLYAGAVF